MPGDNNTDLFRRLPKGPLENVLCFLSVQDQATLAHASSGANQIIGKYLPILKKLESSIYIDDPKLITKAEHFLYGLGRFRGDKTDKKFMNNRQFKKYCAKQLYLCQKYLLIQKLYDSLSPEYKEGEEGEEGKKFESLFVGDISRNILEKKDALLNLQSAIFRAEQAINYQKIEESGEEASLFHSLGLSLKYSFGLTCLPKSWVEKNTSITMLNLSYNKLTELPKSIRKITSLRKLELQYNQLTKLPKSIGKLTELELLDLQKNQLTKLPISIGNLTNLRELVLQENQLTKLPECIGKLESLKEAYISKNQLTELPESIGNLKSLEFLYLENNKLTELPESLSNLNSLGDLNINNNQLTELPDSIGNLKSLNYINIDNNQLTCEPQCVRKLTNTKFMIKNNPFNTVDLSQREAERPKVR